MARQRFGQRNFGVTVTDDKWGAFVKRALETDSLVLRVGILRGAPKYPAGHVGRKSRQADRDGSRFAALKANVRSTSMLAAHRSAKGAKRMALQLSKGQFTGYARKRRRTRIAVAKVAFVVGFQPGKPVVIPTMWAKTVDRLGNSIHRNSLMAARNIQLGRSAAPDIQRIGQRVQAAFRADVDRSGHVDSRLLRRTVKWELADTERELAKRRLASAARIARRQLKAGGRIIPGRGMRRGRR